DLKSWNTINKHLRDYQMLDIYPFFMQPRMDAALQQRAVQPVADVPLLTEDDAIHRQNLQQNPQQYSDFTN
ncbi:hypothetical protein GGI12_004812, partial [Dipsacomyces acuminosporus]